MIVITRYQIKELIVLCDVAYVIAILCVILASMERRLRFLLKYGKTLTGSHSNGWLSIYVPKSFFTHFYVIDLIFSIVNILALFRSRQIVSGQVSSNIWAMPISRTQFETVIVMMLIQSSRRLYECFFVSKFAKTAKIHLFHYLAGWFFYVTVNLLPLLGFELGYNEITDIKLLPLALFGFASIDQWQNHHYLSTLVKYTLPNKGLFHFVSCAHYFDEILIYLSYFLVLRNGSAFIVLLWVIINLSVSANQSWLFYKSKFTTGKHYWRIIPFIY